MATSLKYILFPFVAWIACGSIKFLVNLIRARFDLSEARRLIGYGGFPSTHTTVVSSAVFFVGFEHGFDSSIFTLGLAILIIVIMDAHGLRRNVGWHAERLNALAEKFPDTISNQSSEINSNQNQNLKQFPNKNTSAPLRERMGHSYFEIAGGLALGFFLANLVSRL